MAPPGWGARCRKDARVGYALEVQLKAAMLASPVTGTSGIDVFCRQGIVVLAG
jgi:hypothetical protein